MNDIWVCSTCKSINRQRDRQCYHCRASQDAALAPEGPDLRTTNAVANRAVRTYLPAWPLAILAGALLVAVAALGVVLLLWQIEDYPALRAAFIDALNGNRAALGGSMATQSADVAGLSLVRSVITLLALGSFAGWLAVATMNVPALGGGYPSRGPVRVFIYTLIPVWNLFRVPGMIQDVLYRVDPRSGGALMVMAATAGLVGSWLVSAVGGWAIVAAGIRSMLAAGTPEARLTVFAGVLDQSLVLGVITELMITLGTVLIVVLMVRIERRCAMRDREIREAAAAGI